LAEPLPEDVCRFLGENIESIDQLEVLRVLGEGPAREWTAAALAAEVQGPPADMAEHLAALARRGLIATERRGAEAVWRYAPASPELDGIVGRLLKCYRERPVSMIKLVYAQAADPLRAFADAFRLRKKGD
jgi:hypothetical protein